jgi:hypothetical protein
VNPFVYWAQAFGTNDVLSAVPLLAAALLARRGNRTLAAVALGLACAVKQLAWPFAPFLIVELAGLRAFRELLSATGWRRLARPALIAGATFAAIVLPVAALDPGAFVADIVRYQTGSPGTDQYPFGGTPGFGIANLLIYAGAVRELSDYYPFQRFYLLLVPLGLLLLRFQFRRPGLPAAFVAGSVALLASVYVSRIPNPNYLILATLFLPLAVLLDPDLPTDLALAPLLLLAMSSEAALREPLRSAWEAGGFGFPQWLAPSAIGPRWRDPLSLGWSGLASTLAIVTLIAAVAGASRRLREGLVVAAAGLVLGLPLWALVASDAANGVVHAQEGWIAEVLGARDTPGPGAWGQRPGIVRTPVVEAWPASWRKDPPRALPETPASPGAFALGRALRSWRWDPRVIAALALLAAGIVATRMAPAVARPAVLAVCFLSPASLGAVLFGAGDSLTLLAILAALALAGREAKRRAACFLGAAGTLSLGAWSVAPVALTAPRRNHVLVFVLAFAVLGAPLVFGFPEALRQLVVTTSGLRPGIGLSNVFYYRPDAPGVLLDLLRWACVPCLLAVAWLLTRAVRDGASRTAATALGLLATAFLWPGLEASTLVAPLVLLAVAAHGSAAR